MNPGKRSEDEEDHPLNCRQRGSTQNFAQNNRGARYWSYHHGEQESFLAVLDQRHHGKDGSEEYDHDERTRIEIVQVVLLTLASAGAERGAESRANYHPEHERRGQHPDHSRLLPVEADNLTPPQGKCRQQHSRGSGSGGPDQGDSLT